MRKSAGDGAEIIPRWRDGIVHDEDIEALTHLGLTVAQSRVYLALASCERATVNVISKTADIARQDIYRIVSKLQEAGIVERIMAKPNAFRALPIEDGVKILLQHRQEQNAAAQTKATQLIQRYAEREPKPQPQTHNPQIILVPEKQAVILRLKKATESAQASIDVTSTWKRFTKAAVILFDDFEKALSRGVDVRAVVEKPEPLGSWPKETQVLAQKPSFQLRTTPTPPAAILAIYDKKEMLMATSPTGSLAASPALWSDNPSLLVPMQEYFEQTWRKASEDKKHRMVFWRKRKKADKSGSQPELAASP